MSLARHAPFPDRHISKGDLDIPTRPSVRGYIAAGILVLGLLFGGFGSWAALAPLSSAAIASGQVKVDSYRKTVQHQADGIIREIFVREGDAVKQGQVLLRLDDADTEADLNDIRGQIGAIEAEIASMQAQLPSIEEQLRDQQTLYKKGFAKKPDLFALQRTEEKMKGDIEADQKKLVSLHEQEKKVQLRLERNVVTAPQDGVVMNLRFHTAGGVIKPGDDILDIVPVRDKLVLEVKVRPLDIDVVHPDLPATVRFVAYKQRVTPTVEGKVTRVSADAVSDVELRNATTSDSHPNEPYFLATVEVEADQLARVPNVKLYPGMPVEAAIVTGKRTLFAYLAQPITDSFAHAFREE